MKLRGLYGLVLLLVVSSAPAQTEIRFDPGTCGSVTLRLGELDAGATCLVACGIGSISASCQHARSDARVREKPVRDPLDSLAVRVFGRATVLDLATHLQDMTGWELDVSETLEDAWLAEFGWIGSIDTIESLRLPLRDGRFLELRADRKDREIVAQLDQTIRRRN